MSTIAHSSAAHKHSAEFACANHKIAMTPSQARNAIKKAIVEIIDPKPRTKAINAMWRHFCSRCAFCGIKLQQRKREGHADHLVASASGGPNAIFNRVFACAKCNGKEKLDAAWQDFLDSKRQTSAKRDDRRLLSQKWQKKHQPNVQIDPETVAMIRTHMEEAIRAFDQAIQKARALQTRVMNENSEGVFWKLFTYTMTNKESLQNSLDYAVQKYGDNALVTLDIRRQLQEIEQEQPSKSDKALAGLHTGSRPRALER